jgi:hypothetical protein
MKKYFSFNAIFLLMTIAAYSHPGIGIVKDSRGFIYYTDLKDVWKINPKTLKESVVVHNVHTHELYMDTNDNLYGEHLWYNGEKLNTWGHYVWRLNSNGRLDSIIKPTEGFLDNYSFTRDSIGNMYWVQRFITSRFKKKSPDGSIRTIAEGKFKDIRWLHAGKDGTLYFIDLTSLYKIDTMGKVVILAKDLHERTSVFEYGSLKHNILGIWLDKEGSVYIAVHGGQVVKKITKDGKVSSVVYSNDGWRPAGGLFDNEGNLWLLEDHFNNTRVRKIDSNTLVKSPSAITNIINKTKPIATLLVLVLLVILFVKWIASKRKKNFIT